MFQITDINITRCNNNHKLLAYVTLILDNCLVIHNIKIIQGHDRLFVSMPDKPTEYRCPSCNKRIRLRANYCQYCGTALKPVEIEKNEYLNIVAPITTGCRQYIHETIMAKYNEG